MDKCRCLWYLDNSRQTYRVTPPLSYQIAIEVFEVHSKDQPG